MTLVTLDVSATAAWLLPDEVSASSDALYRQVLDRSVKLQAPSLWAWEAGNLLRQALKRGRLVNAGMREALATLRRLDVRLETAPDEARMRAVLDLAALRGLSFYDASYLEQASRTGAALATADAGLRRAAGVQGVPCLA